MSIWCFPFGIVKLTHGFLLMLCLEKISSRVSNFGPTGSYRIRRYIPTTCAIRTEVVNWNPSKIDLFFIFGALTPLSTIFQLYHGDQLYRWRKPEYPGKTTDHGQAIGKLYHLRCESSAPFFVIYKAGKIHLTFKKLLYLLWYITSSSILSYQYLIWVNGMRIWVMSTWRSWETICTHSTEKSHDLQQISRKTLHDIIFQLLN